MTGSSPGTSGTGVRAASWPGHWPPSSAPKGKGQPEPLPAVARVPLKPSLGPLPPVYMRRAFWKTRRSGALTTSLAPLAPAALPSGGVLEGILGGSLSPGASLSYLFSHLTSHLCFASRRRWSGDPTLKPHGPRGLSAL